MNRKNKKTLTFAVRIADELNKIGQGPEADELYHSIFESICETKNYYKNLLVVRKRDADAITPKFKVEI